MQVDYARAEAMLTHRRRALVTHTDVVPYWDGGARLTYRVRTPAGTRYVYADVKARCHREAFDHEALARALGEATRVPVDSGKLDLESVTVDGRSVEFDFDGSRWRCDRSGRSCEAIHPLPAIRAGERVSPDRRLAAFVREHNLWVRDLGSGEEHPLTTDGESDHAYASPPDLTSHFVLLAQRGMRKLPSAIWSPDSTKLVTHRIDQRAVAKMQIVQSSPPRLGRPVAFEYRYPMPGDPDLPMAELCVVDIVSRRIVRARCAPLLAPYMSPIKKGEVWWADDGSTIFFVRSNRGSTHLTLCALDPSSGEVKTVVEESASTRVELSQSYGRPIVRVLDRTGEVLWWSQRDGWGHLYLYDRESGRLKCRVTTGEMLVREIIHVDDAERIAYLSVSGLVPDDPYLRQFCSVRLDGSEFRRLTHDRRDHDVSSSPDGSLFLDSSSTVSEPPVTVLLARDGRQVMELERGDADPLVDAGWSPPERFVAKANDGTTDVYGVLFRPSGEPPTNGWPIIDVVYPGPHVAQAPAGFEFQAHLPEPESLAALGFAAVCIDGRGTPGRSKAFHDFSYGNLGSAGALEDHVAALEQLGRRYRELDLTRVGIAGHSGGGFAAVRGMLDYPDFYKVGVALSGSHDLSAYQAGWGELYHGLIEDVDYESASNIPLAGNLQGRLLLVHGELDENVTAYSTLRLVDALVAADKDFDLLILPNEEHLLARRQPYVIRRCWDFFVRHLMLADPPHGYRLGEIPLEPNVIRSYEN